MENRRNIQDEMIVFSNMQNIVEAYEEIAAMRMRKVKKSVLLNRDFLSGLNDIYQRVVITYKLYAEKKHFKGSRKEWLPLDTNGKTVSVLVSANTGLYGNIIKKTYQLFKENVDSTPTDIAIIGRIGRQMYDLSDDKRPYKYFSFADTGIDRNNMGDILGYLLQYSNIVVYHGIYVSVLSQKPTKTFITGKALDLQKETSSEEIRCLIEPSVEEVTEFFEKQILASVFEQSLYEASLSKFASRMISLDVASENISDLVQKNKFKRLKIKHMTDNLRQSERLSGLSLWGAGL